MESSEVPVSELPDTRQEHGDQKRAIEPTLGERRDQLAQKEAMTPQQVLTAVFGLNSEAIRLAGQGPALASELHANYSVGLLRAREMAGASGAEYVTELLEQRIIDIEDALVQGSVAPEQQQEPYVEPPRNPMGFTIPDTEK